MGVTADTQVQPRTTYNFRILVDDLNAGLAHSVQISEKEIAKFTHASGGQNFDTSHPGKIKWSDLVIEKAMPNAESDPWAASWMQESRGVDGTGNPLAARRIVTIEHLADDGDTVIDSWTHNGCWVMKISYSKNDAGQEAEKMVETVTISVDFADERG